MILAIDPGTFESGWVLIDETNMKPVQFGKDSNLEVIETIRRSFLDYGVRTFVIEKIASYGMPVGQEVFDTCEWVGSFRQVVRSLMGYPKELPVYSVTRRQEKLTICHNPKANDATIRQALVDRFAYGVSNYGKGTKKEPGWFYGFKADIWQAYAVGVTYLDRRGGSND